MKSNNVLVVGGGASGMLAAISALENGAKVTIIERNNRLGKKVLVTGNGRCNLTNLNITADNYHGQNTHFVNNIFSQFDNTAAIEFFNKLGVVTKVEANGRVFPMSDQASSVVDILTHRLKELGCRIIYEAKVERVKKEKEVFKVTFDNTKEMLFDKIIIASGGRAVPTLGSDGSGYRLAQALGHKITPVWPALVQVKLKGGFFEYIKGVKVDGAAILIAGGREIKKEAGEILFTHYGVSGPAILKISREVKKQIMEGKEVFLNISLLNNHNLDTLDKFLANRFVQLGKKALKTSFLGFMQKRLIPYLLKASSIKDIDKKCAEVSAKERRAIAATILGWNFKVIDTNDFKDAQVTAGGVKTDEIDPKTLESKLVSGLFFCGEVLDVDGDSGGYNLQFAWSSGYIAGKSAARK